MFLTNIPAFKFKCGVEEITITSNLLAMIAYAFSGGTNDVQIGAKDDCRVQAVTVLGPGRVAPYQRHLGTLRPPPPEPSLYIDGAGEPPPCSGTPDRQCCHLDGSCPPTYPHRGRPWSELLVSSIV